MARKNSNPHRRQNSNGSSTAESTARVDLPPTSPKQHLSLHIPPTSRRKKSLRGSLTSPIQIRSSTAEITIVGDAETAPGIGGFGDDDEEDQSDDVDDDNICLVCVANCTCGKTEQQQPKQSPKQQYPRLKQESSITPVQPHFTRQHVKLRLSSPHYDSTPETVPKRRGRSSKIPSPESLPINTRSNGHTYGTRLHANVIVRDGRGQGKNGTETVRHRQSKTKSDITVDVSDIDLDHDEEEEEEEEDEDDEDEDDSDEDDSDLGDDGDDVDIEGEEERAIIAEESRRLKSYSDNDDADADEEEEEEEDDDDLDEEDLFPSQRYTSSESSPDEDHEFYQNDLYLDASFHRPAEGPFSQGCTSPRRKSNESDLILYENPILKVLIEEQGLGSITPYRGDDVWNDSEDDRVGWECFIDDTDVEMGEDWMHIDDEETRYGGGDTTDEEDFKLLGPPAIPVSSSATKRKQKKSNTLEIEVVTTSHRPPPLATWERDGAEITIIDALPTIQSPLPSPFPPPAETPPPQATTNLPSLDEFFDSTLLATHEEDESMSDASVSSIYTVTRTAGPRSRKNSSATATSFGTDSFITPTSLYGRGNRKVPLGSYRRKVMLGERSLEAQEKSVFLKEWYTLQERRNLRKMSKSRNLESFDLLSSPTRGRRREKLRTAQRARRDHDASSELDMQFIKRRRTSDVQGSGSSTAAFMERLGLDLGTGDISEEEDEDYDDEEFDLESRVVNGGGGERMVLDDDLELGQFIVPPSGGIDLSPLFGAVDAS